MRVCSLQLFDLSTPKASNCDPTACNYFFHMQNIFEKITNFSKLSQFWSVFEVWCIYGNICPRAFRILDCQTDSHNLSHTFTHSSQTFHFIWALLRPQIVIRRRANISRVIIHIRIVLNNAKYLITWSNFVGFGNSRYQQNQE